MKTLPIFIIILALLSSCASSNSSTTKSLGSLTFNYSTVGILDGYDHTSKLIIYDNGNKIGESVPKKESAGNSVTIPLSNGKHSIRAVLNSLYEEKWEEHLKANEYSLDCLFEQDVDINGKKVIKLVFDITEEKTIITN